MIYLKLEEDVESASREVLLSDVAQITGDEEKKLDCIKALRVHHFDNSEEKRVVISVITLIEMIAENFPGTQVSVMGATDVIIEYLPDKKRRDRWKIPKIILVCGICFFGAAFSIMSFHNDIGIQGLCNDVYMIFGVERDGTFPVLELGYSVGLGAGIIIFYNHIGKRRLSKEPTPVEVEIRLYEKDVNDTIIENAKRIKKEK